MLLENRNNGGQFIDDICDFEFRVKLNISWSVRAFSSGGWDFVQGGEGAFLSVIAVLSDAVSAKVWNKRDVPAFKRVENKRVRVWLKLAVLQMISPVATLHLGGLHEAFHWIQFPLLVHRQTSQRRIPIIHKLKN